MKRMLCVLLLAVAGCGPLVTRPEPPALYDLGSTRLSQAVGLALGGIDVRAPSWLEGMAMHYRLAYESDTRRDVYAHSRWTAAPAEMLSVALQRMIETPVVVAPTCSLRIDIDEFIQHFDQVGRMHGLITARASLIEVRGQRVLARKAFSISETATRADAPGGVAALARGVDALGEQLGEWLNSAQLKELHDGC